MSGAYGTRGEHLAWCKQRAYEYLDKGDIINSWASFCSDISKHPETDNPMLLGVIMIAEIAPANQTGNVERARKAIEGFN